MEINIVKVISKEISEGWQDLHHETGQEIVIQREILRNLSLFWEKPSTLIFLSLENA